MGKEVVVKEAARDAACDCVLQTLSLSNDFIL